MKKDSTFVQYVTEDLLGYMDNVMFRAMFGGYGIYRLGIMFALVGDGELYFKVGIDQKEKYKELKSRPFTYMKEGKAQELSYYCISEEIQENRDLFRELARESYELALEKMLKKPLKIKK